MIRPLGKNVTALMLDAEKTTKSGLFLPAGTAEALSPRIAEIVAVGPDCVSGVKLGDQVVFKPYATYEVEENEIKYSMIEEEDILGVVEKASTTKVTSKKSSPLVLE